MCSATQELSMYLESGGSPSKRLRKSFSDPKEEDDTLESGGQCDSEESSCSAGGFSKDDEGYDLCIIRKPTSIQSSANPSAPSPNPPAVVVSPTEIPPNPNPNSPSLPLSFPILPAMAMDLPPSPEELAGKKHPRSPLGSGEDCDEGSPHPKRHNHSHDRDAGEAREAEDAPLPVVLIPSVYVAPGAEDDEREEGEIFEDEEVPDYMISDHLGVAAAEHREEQVAVPSSVVLENGNVMNDTDGCAGKHDTVPVAACENSEELRGSSMRAFVSNDDKCDERRDDSQLVDSDGLRKMDTKVMEGTIPRNRKEDDGWKLLHEVSRVVSWSIVENGKSSVSPEGNWRNDTLREQSPGHGNKCDKVHVVERSMSCDIREGHHEPERRANSSDIFVRRKTDPERRSLYKGEELRDVGAPVKDVESKKVCGGEHSSSRSWYERSGGRVNSRERNSEYDRDRSGDCTRDSERRRDVMRERDGERGRHRSMEHSGDRERRNGDREKEKHSGDRDRCNGDRVKEKRSGDHERCSQDRGKEKHSEDRGKERERGRDRERGRSREHERGNEKDREKEKHSGDHERCSQDRGKEKHSEDRGKERERGRDRERGRSREHERGNEKDMVRDHTRERGRSRERYCDSKKEIARTRDRERGRSRDRSRDRAKERDRGKEERDREKMRVRDETGDRARAREFYDRDNDREREMDRERDRGSRRESDRGVSRQAERGGSKDRDDRRDTHHPKHDERIYQRDRHDLNVEEPSSRKVEEDYQEKVEMQLVEQEEEDPEKIIEESRKRRLAILEKYKQQQSQRHLQPDNQQKVESPDESAEGTDTLSDLNILAQPEGMEEKHDSSDDVADISFSVGKSPPQNGASVPEKLAASGLGFGTPKSEKSADMFCDDIFGESPAGVRKPGKGEDIVVDRSGVHDNWDDAEGYYIYRLGEIVDGRYEIMAAHGKGVFSTVVRAKDLKAGQGDPLEVAIKIIRNNDTMFKAGLEELVILNKLAGADPEDRRHCVRFLSSFKYRNHLCLVFESLHMNLREVLKKFGRNIGLKLTAVRAYAKQLFIALKHLRNCGVLHCDIKPDNMLVNEAKNVLKLCDFGNAMFAGKNEITPYLVSRFYRAPEIILGLAYDHPMDIWSVGCCLFELYIGKVLFPGPTNNDMLRLHMELKGPFPKKMLRKGAFTERHFDQDMNFHATDEDHVTKKTIKRLLLNIKPKDIGALFTSFPEEDPKMLAHFKDLLERIFILDPDKRITVSQALSHPFITGK